MKRAAAYAFFAANFAGSISPEDAYNFLYPEKGHGIKRPICPKCGRKFKTTDGLVNHIHEYHERKKKWS